jgi:hypothetical protein
MASKGPSRAIKQYTTIGRPIDLTSAAIIEQNIFELDPVGINFIRRNKPGTIYTTPIQLSSLSPPEPELYRPQVEARARGKIIDLVGKFCLDNVVLNEDTTHQTFDVPIERLLVEKKGKKEKTDGTRKYLVAAIVTDQKTEVYDSYLFETEMEKINHALGIPFKERSDKSYPKRVKVSIGMIDVLNGHDLPPREDMEAGLEYLSLKGVGPVSVS